MKKIMWIISLIPLVITAIVLQYLPESVPMHYDFTGSIDRWGSKYEELLFPLVALALALFWTLLIGYYEKKASTAALEKESAGAASNAKVLVVTGTAMAAMFTAIHGYSLYRAYQAASSNSEIQTADIGQFTNIIIGIVLIVVASFLPKTRINGAVGLRVSWSMYNDNTWRKSNRFSAYALMITGLLIIITSALLNSSTAATLVLLGYISVALIVILIYAHKVYKDEILREKEHKTSSD
jgi:uncharacterized membrane protein